MVNRIGALFLVIIIVVFTAFCIITWGFAPELLWVFVAASIVSCVLYTIQFRTARRLLVLRLFGIVLLTMIGGALSSRIAFGGSSQVFFGYYVLIATTLGAFLGLMGSIVGFGVAYATRLKQE